MTVEKEYICPQCHNPIYDEDALLCHFCGGSLERSGKGFISGIRYGNKRGILFFLVFFVLLSLILLYVF